MASQPVRSWPSYMSLPIAFDPVVVLLTPQLRYSVARAPESGSEESIWTPISSCSNGISFLSHVWIDHFSGSFMDSFFYRKKGNEARCCQNQEKLETPISRLHGSILFCSKQTWSMKIPKLNFQTHHNFHVFKAPRPLWKSSPTQENLHGKSSLPPKHRRKKPLSHRRWTNLQTHLF